MGPDYRIVTKAGNQCSRVEIQDFASLARAGGEVISEGLEDRVRNAELLVFLEWNGCLVGVSALKNPTAHHREEVSERSGIRLSVNDFPFELGYIFVSPSARNNHFSRPLTEAALEAAREKGVFATSRANNDRIHSTLEKFDFKKAGKPYLSKDGENMIQVFLRRPKG